MSASHIISDSTPNRASHPTFEKIHRLREEARELKVPLWFRRSFEETFQ